MALSSKRTERKLCFDIDKGIQVKQVDYVLAPLVLAPSQIEQILCWEKKLSDPLKPSNITRLKARRMVKIYIQLLLHKYY
jgi:hypothetical protein